MSSSLTETERVNRVPVLNQVSSQIDCSCSGRIVDKLSGEDVVYDMDTGAAGVSLADLTGEDTPGNLRSEECSVKHNNK